MSTETAPDTTETIALTRALLEAGWSYTSPIRTEPQWRSRIHELASPDGRLTVHACVYPDGRTTASLSAEAVRTGPSPVPGWMADLDQLALSVVLAAVDAAPDDAPGPRPAEVAVAAALTAAGWTQHADIKERGRTLEREWADPDLTRYVRWHPADQHDAGGWTVDREGSGGATSQISQHTPAAVITALALTDDPDMADGETPHQTPATSPPAPEPDVRHSSDQSCSAGSLEESDV